ncbi:MAG: phosphate ABC transporter substrate-binding protein [Pseudoflavonifractor sp.]|nr:phosphate ABC transporter substrate-binding protein [Pseudoflavonifractor sp.]
MKKNVSMLLSAALCVGLLASCGSGGNSAESAAPSNNAAPAQSAAALSGTVSTNGSTSMEKVMGALIEQFKTVEPGITVTYDPTGSGSGIEAASNGSADIGLSSRGLKDEEKSGGLTETVVAKDGIAVVVNPANSVEDLTVEQIAAIAKGEITNWSDVGGADAEIAFIGREAGSGTRGAFEELTETTDACVYTQELTSTGAVITAVSTTPGAIGYASLSAVEDTVKAVKVGGVACTEETVLDGTYAIQRPFVFATKGGLSETAQAFYDFATDPANAELYTAAGVVPANR